MCLNSLRWGRMVTAGGAEADDGAFSVKRLKVYAPNGKVAIRCRGFQWF